MRLKTVLGLSMILLLLSGCGAVKEPDPEFGTEAESINEILHAGEIPFTYFYRGFTPLLPEENWNFEGVYLPVLIENEEDWRDFAEDFCPTADFLKEPDFEKQCLLVSCSPHGSRWGENVSTEIDSVRVKDGEMLLSVKEHSAKDVYAVNAGGVGHLFVNVLLLEKERLPEGGFTNVTVYRAGMAGKEEPDQNQGASDEKTDASVGNTGEEKEMENKMEIEMFCPQEYTKWSADVDYGELVKTTYYSATCEKERPVNILLPAGYDESREYPVLYVLHGIFGSQNDMVGSERSGNRVTIGNLIAEGLAKEMIVVFPYMYASKTQDACTAIDEENCAAYDNFVNDLRDDLMPFLKDNYSVKEGRENTAIVGFSMGGRESLAIALQMQETIGYVGAIAPAPGLVPGKDWAMTHPGQFAESELVFDKEYPIVFMICCGDSDKTVGTFPKSYHEIFERNGQEHIWWEVKGSDHGDPAITSGIYNFCRNIF